MSKKDRTTSADANSPDHPVSNDQENDQEPDGPAADNDGADDPQLAPQIPGPVVQAAKAVRGEAIATETAPAETKPDDQKSEESDAATATTATTADPNAALPVQPAVPAAVASIAVPVTAAAPHQDSMKSDSGSDAAPAAIEAMTVDTEATSPVALPKTTLPTTPKIEKKAQASSNSLETAGTKPAQAPSAANSDQSVAPNTDDGGHAGKPQPAVATATENAGNSENARVRTMTNGDAHKTDTTANQPAPTHFATDNPSDKPTGALQFVTLQQQSAPSTSPTTPSAPTPANPPVAVPLIGLAVTIATQAQAGHNRFAIRLDPPELGRIDVRLDVDKSGHVTSHLVVDRPDTLDALQRDAGDLQRALQQAGLKTSDNGLQFSLRDQSFAGRDNPFTPPGAARLVVPDPELAPAESLSTDYRPALRAAGGIDIRV